MPVSGSSFDAQLAEAQFWLVCHECDILFLLLKAAFLLALCPASVEVVALQLLGPWAAWAEAEGVVVASWNGHRASIRLCFLLLIVGGSVYMRVQSLAAWLCRLACTKCRDQVMVVVGTFRHSLAAGVPILSHPPLRHPNFTAPDGGATTLDAAWKTVDARPVAPSMSIVRLHTAAT